MINSKKQTKTLHKSHDLDMKKIKNGTISSNWGSVKKGKKTFDYSSSTVNESVILNHRRE